MFKFDNDDSLDIEEKEVEINIPDLPQCSSAEVCQLKEHLLNDDFPVNTKELLVDKLFTEEKIKVNDKLREITARFSLPQLDEELEHLLDFKNSYIKDLDKYNVELEIINDRKKILTDEIELLQNSLYLITNEISQLQELIRERLSEHITIHNYIKKYGN